MGNTQDTLSSVAHGDTPVLEQLALMQMDTLERSGLDSTAYHLARLAALVAMDAAPVSYLANLSVAAEDGITLEQAQGVLVAVAPIVGGARIASAAGHLLEAFGVATQIEDARR
jgi:alkylhydroperoxidase/carboxymuconolactone decarboxylase family protein YurZ